MSSKSFLNNVLLNIKYNTLLSFIPTSCNFIIQERVYIPGVPKLMQQNLVTDS